MLNSKITFHVILQCRAIAAVVLGNADKIHAVSTTWSTRYDELNHRYADLLIMGDTHTIEREVSEVSFLKCFLLIKRYLCCPDY